MRLTDRELEPLLRAGESDRVELKHSLGGSAPSAIREAICAFSNDLPDYKQPGVVFVGVTDQGAPSGIPVTDELLRQLADIKTDGAIVPPPSVSVEKRTVGDADIAVVTVLPSDSPPVRYKGRILVRIGPRRGVATAQDERILNERRRYGDRPFDLQRVPSSVLKDLSIRQFEDAYLPQAVSRDVLDANDRSLQERLAATKMIAAADDPVPTLLGLLVLGVRPRDFLPGAYIQFLRINGQDHADPIIDSAEIDGAVPDIMRRLDEKLTGHNRVSVDFTQRSIERRTEAYPLSALQQFVRNAVMHRTYEGTHAPIRVSWFNDRIEIASPGGPFGTVTTTNFGQPGVTDYRNPNLAEAMKVLGYVQRYGVGIPTARRILAQSNHPPPHFDVTDRTILVTIQAARQ